MADLTRDDLARLKSLRDEAVGAAAGGAYADAILDCADALLAAAERDLDRREGLVLGVDASVPYAPASALDALRAENERLRATLEGATVLGAVSARHCGKPAPGELPCRRTPGHLDPCMGLFGEALAADLADARAEVDHLRGYVKDIIAESGRFAAARDAAEKRAADAYRRADAAEAALVTVHKTAEATFAHANGQRDAALAAVADLTAKLATAAKETP